MTGLIAALRTWKLENLYRHDDPARASAVATSRMLDLISGTDHGHFLLSMRGDGDGSVQIRFAVSGADDVSSDDVEWIFAPIGDLARNEWDPVPTLPARLQELVPTVSVADPGLPGMAAQLPTGVAPGDLWPRELTSSGIEILRALAGSAGEFRVHLAAAPSFDRAMAQERLLASGRPADSGASPRTADPVWLGAYVGQPVEIRCLAGGGRSISPRLRAALLNLGIGITLVERNPASREIAEAWRGGRVAMRATALPVGAARALFRVPCSPSVPVICGVPVITAPTEDVAIDEDVCREGLRLGVAMTPEGRMREVRIAEEDQLLHTEVIGATGTGKSSLLAEWVAEAAKAGVGVSVIDPHGTLVTRLIKELPTEMATRTVVVRSGDLEHPVPVNPLSTEDWELAQDTMIQVFNEIFDPRHQGITGPVFERLLAVLLELQRALVGDRASFSAVPAIFGTRSDMRSLVPHLPRALARRLVTELIGRSEEDYSESMTWVASKFQRLLSSGQMRAITASGKDAVDVTRLVDQRKLLLVDLASPALGPMSSQMLGEMWLAKHWAAMAHRADPHQLHLLIVDEAHLFASGLLPRILAEGRKFGFGAVLAHQNLDQLGYGLQAALESTTSNIISFRTGIREAASVAQRLGSWSGGSLNRLPRLRAAATLSAGVAQSEPFTLVIDHNSRVSGRNDPQAAKLFAESSWKRYSDPYRDCQPLTWEYFMDAAQQPPEKKIVAAFAKWWRQEKPLSKVQESSRNTPTPYFNEATLEELGYTGLDPIRAMMLAEFALVTFELRVGTRLIKLAGEHAATEYDRIANSPEAALEWFRESELAVPEKLSGWESAGPRGQAQMVDWIRGKWIFVTIPDYQDHVKATERELKNELRDAHDELMTLMDEYLAPAAER
ncbi:MAG: ATP-binding protein [Acidipropionibacterium sp.]|jgi:hypothetical protein|nr:ATP-binding protein [Acidipropionibacterium sp.]